MESLNAALASDQAHLVFRDRDGTLRDFAVRTLWKQPSDAKYGPQPGAVPWNQAVSVTNDGAILEYLLQAVRVGRLAELPSLPAAGDRPAFYLDPRRVRVGIVNAGGPAPGLNVVNDSITKRHFQLVRDSSAKDGSTVVFGYRKGFEGVAGGDKRVLIPTRRLEEWARCRGEGEPLVTDDHALDPVTFLKSSRFNLTKAQNLTAVVDGIQRDRLDVLYVVGGNGTQRAGVAIKAELNKRSYRGPLGEELVVVGGPKTMDNDLLFADTTFGFTTTVDHLVEAIRVFHNTADCMQRVGVMQVFGAASGFVALYGSYSSGNVDYVVIPEVVQKAGILALLDSPQSDDCIDLARFQGMDGALRAAGYTLEEVCAAGILVVMAHAEEEVHKRFHADGKEHALVVVAEGAKGPFGHGGTGVELMSFSEMLQRLEKRMKPVRVSPLEPQYLIRDNAPHSYDIALCKFIGKAMADAALAGYTDCMVTRWCGKHALVPLSLATEFVNCVDPRDYFYRTMAVRYKQELNRGFVTEHWPTILNDNSEWLCRKGLEHLLVEARLRGLAQTQFGQSECARVEAAVRLARHAHYGQSRKQGGPYIIHPLRVAVSLVEEFGPSDADLVVAALLHDVLEDGPDRVSPQDIESACGKQVLELVQFLTSPTEAAVADKAERNRLKAEKVRQGPREAWCIKLADRIDNLRDACLLSAPDLRPFRTRYYEESLQYYLPLAEQLGNDRLRSALHSAMSKLQQ